MYLPTPEEEETIEVGLRDIENGNVVSDEEAQIIFNKWLKELSGSIKEPSVKHQKISSFGMEEETQTA